RRGVGGVRHAGPSAEAEELGVQLGEGAVKVANEHGSWPVVSDRSSRLPFQQRDPLGDRWMGVPARALVRGALRPYCGEFVGSPRQQVWDVGQYPDWCVAAVQPPPDVVVEIELPGCGQPR